MSYLTIVRFYLHQRGIQALLVGGCVLGFGLGQTVNINTGTHAQQTNQTSSGRAAVVAKSQAGGGLGDNVSGQQAVRVPSPVQTQVQPAPQQPKTSAADTNQGKHDAKGHHKHADGKGSGDQNNPKAKRHRQEDNGGAQGKQGKDNSGQGHDASAGGSGQTGSGSN